MAPHSNRDWSGEQAIFIFHDLGVDYITEQLYFSSLNSTIQWLHHSVVNFIYNAEDNSPTSSRPPFKLYSFLNLVAENRMCAYFLLVVIQTISLLSVLFSEHGIKKMKLCAAI